MLPHCADCHFVAYFGDGRTVHIRTCVQLKPPGAAADVELPSSEETQVADAMNLLLDTFRELDHS